MPVSPRIGLFALLIAATAAADERSQGLDAWVDFGRFIAMTTTLHRSQAVCSTLFPDQAAVIRGYYEASSVPTYAKAFGPALTPLETDDRDKLLESLGKSEGEVASWCSIDFPKALDKFDGLYAGRVQELLPTVEAMGNAAPSNQPAQRLPSSAELDRLFARIVDRSNRAYQTGDWSVLADLYDPGTFDCWRGAPGAGTFEFLAFPPLSSKATYKVSQFTEFDPGAPYSFSHVPPTHLMEFQDEISRPGGRCGMTERKKYPGGYFFLVQQGAEFHLTHYCPSREAVAAGEIPRSRTFSAAQMAANVARIPAAEWEAIASDLKQDRYSGRPGDRLVKTYGFSYDEADEVIGYVCDPANTP